MSEIHDFENWLKDKVVTVDMRSNQILVAKDSSGAVVTGSINGRNDCVWASAVESYLQDKSLELEDKAKKNKTNIDR